MTILNFKFKGDREYVHGSDIFDYVNDFIRDKLPSAKMERIDMTILRSIKNNLKISLYKNQILTKDKSVVAIFAFSIGSDNYTILIEEAETFPIESYAYDEDLVVALCNINTEAKIIHLSQESNYTTIETIIAMNKKLLQNCFPEFKDKWVFTRIQLHNDPIEQKCCNVSLQLKNNFNFKLTKTLILQGEEELGFIYFSSQES